MLDFLVRLGFSWCASEVRSGQLLHHFLPRRVAVVLLHYSVCFAGQHFSNFVCGHQALCSQSGIQSSSVFRGCHHHGHAHKFKPGLPFTSGPSVSHCHLLCKKLFAASAKQSMEVMAPSPCKHPSTHSCVCENLVVCTFAVIWCPLCGLLCLLGCDVMKTFSTFAENADPAQFHTLPSEGKVWPPTPSHM